MERWLVISNCQTVGLANCLGLLCLEAEVEACDPWRLRKEKDYWLKALPSYDRIFLNDHVVRFLVDEATGAPLFDFSAIPNIVHVPDIVFSGYHPDLCCVCVDGTRILSPVDEYHSAIALASYKKGLDERAARALFRSEFFERARFFDNWDRSRVELLGTFRQCGFDLAAHFRRWSLREAFMHSINHPRIECLYDLAALAVAKAGHSPVVGPLRPHDNLLLGPVFPVYEAIADRYGIAGSHCFKPSGSYRLITLEAFLEGSFARYRKYSPDRLVPSDIPADRFQAILDAI